MNRRQFITLSAAASLTTRARAQAATPAAPLLSFGLLTDVQYADANPAGERHYRASLPKLQAAVAELAGQHLPFSLHLGDVIDRKFVSFATILPPFQKLGHPVHHLLGNHDFTVEDAEKGRVMATLGMPHDYYSFSSSRVKLVMLDTNDVSIYKHPQGSPQDLAAETAVRKHAAAQNAKVQPWNGGVSAAQLTWLEQELTAADAAKTPVLVCGHHPLLPESGTQSWNNRDTIAVLERHRCVRAYLCGHDHAGAEVISNSLPYITFKSVLHEPGVTAYAVLRLFKDRLVIEGRGREKSRVIALKPADS